jgi:hypothetical protein
MSLFKKTRQKIMPKHEKKNNTVNLRILKNPTDIRKLESGTRIEDVKTETVEVSVKTVTAAQAATLGRKKKKW